MNSPIEPLRALLTASTPGIWTVPHFAEHGPGEGCECGYIFGEGQNGMGSICNVTFGEEDEPRETAAVNGKLIAATHNLLPQFIALWESVNSYGSLPDDIQKAKESLNARAREVLS